MMEVKMAIDLADRDAGTKWSCGVVGRAEIWRERKRPVQLGKGLWDGYLLLEISGYGLMFSVE